MRKKINIWNKVVITNIIIFLFNSLAIAAGGKLVGKVIDKNTREPLVGVSVIIEGINMEAATDIEGEYLVK